MRFKKLSLILSGCLMVGALAGCGNSNKETTTTTDGNDTENKVEETVETKVLKVAAFEGGYGKVHWEKIAEKFEATHEGVDVQLTIASNLEEIIRPQIQAGNIPDFIYLSTGKTEALTETFIKEQALIDLTDVLNMTVPGESVTVKDKILPGFLDTAATNPYGDGKTYLAPLFYSPTGLFYNKGLFTEKGYEEPKTWDELFALGDKAKADGIATFSYATSGYFDSVIPAMLASSGGVKAFEDAMNYSDGFWYSDSAQKVLETIAKIGNGYLESSVVANANPQGFKNNQQLILDNKALFIPNGTWLTDEMADAPRADGFEWGFMAYPAFEDGGDAYSLNYLEQMYIPSEAKNADLAKEFMAYMYSDEAVGIIAENAKAVVPVKGAIDIASKYLDPLQIELFSVYDSGAKPVMGGFAATEPVEGLNFGDIYTGTVDSIMTGDKTVADWQKSLQDASDKLRAAIIK